MDDQKEPKLNEDAVYIVEEVINHMTFREACKKFVHFENGFNCETYADFTHCKYVYLIKWMHWSTVHNTWEEERNAEDNEQLLLYKKKHGLPSKTEFDSFYVQSFLTNAFKNGDPELSDSVKEFVEKNWIKPFETSVGEKRGKQTHKGSKRRPTSKKSQSRERRDVSNNNRSSSRDSDDEMFIRKKRAYGIVVNMADANKFITKEEKDRIDRERKKKVAREEAERMEGLDNLDEIENALNRRRSKENVARASRSREEKADRPHKSRSEEKKEKSKEIAKQYNFQDSDIFETDADVGKEKPKSTAQKPTRDEEPNRSGFAVSSRSKRPLEKTGGSLSSVIRPSSHIKSTPSTSFSSKEQSDEQPKRKENRDKTRHDNVLARTDHDDIRKPEETRNHISAVLEPQKRKADGMRHDDISSKNKVPRLKEPDAANNRTSLLEKHIKQKTVEKPSTSREEINVYYNFRQNYKVLSRKCREFEVKVLRRCQSAEQLNKRWCEPKENLNQLDKWLTSAEKIGPITGHPETNIKSLHVDVKWNKKDRDHEYGTSNTHLDSLVNSTGFPKVEGKMLTDYALPVIFTTKRKETKPRRTHRRTESLEPPPVITLDSDEEEEANFNIQDTSGICTLISVFKKMVPADVYSRTSGVLADASKLYAALVPDKFHEKMRKVPENIKMCLINKIIMYIQIKGCKEVKMKKTAKLSSRMCQLFEANDVNKGGWVKVSSLCAPNHGKCRMIDELLLILGEKGRYHKQSVFSSDAFFYCMKYGASCQKKKLIEWGCPFFEEVTTYPGQLEYFVDHSILIIRQFEAKQLIELIEMGVDINQMIWKKVRERTGLLMSPWRLIPTMEFFKTLQEKQLDNISDKTIREMGLILGRISLQLATFVQRRIPGIVEGNFPDYNYHGYLTPVHIIRSVWPSGSANLITYIDWDKEWNNYGEVEKFKCLCLDDDMASKLRKEKFKLIISVFRVTIEGQLPVCQTQYITQNIKIGDLDEGECAPLSLSIHPVNGLCYDVDLKPINGKLKPNQWIFDLSSRNAALFLRSAQVRISMKTSSFEVGTTFLIRVHVLNWKN